MVETDKGVKVGPTSVGYRIITEALIFGGKTLTTSDVVVAAGKYDLGDRSKVAHLSPKLIAATEARIAAMLEDCVERSRLSPDPLPVIVVGGGSILVDKPIAGLELIKPDHFAVANAVGAAIAQVSGEVDQIFRDLPREAAMARARELAEARAVRAGATAATLKLVEMEDIPLAYLPGNSLRVRARVVGDVA